MADSCPKCGEVLVSKTIRKELGTGSIEIPVSEACPKCGFSRDMTGAADVKPPAMPVVEDVKTEEVKRQVIEKPRVTSPPPKARPGAGSPGFNKFLTAGLAILVIGGLAWAFLIAPTSPKEPDAVIQPTPTPFVTSTLAVPVATTVAPVLDVTPTGKKVQVKLDNMRGFFNLIGGSMKIKAGDEVLFTNEGTYTVTLVSTDNLFEPKFLDNGKRTNYIFKNTGSYGFYLKENKNLNGTIIVEP